MDKHTEWICIYRTAQAFEAEVIKGNLEMANIPAVILNKTDSSLLAYVFGTVEIHVPKQFEAEAAEILKNSTLDN